MPQSEAWKIAKLTVLGTVIAAVAAAIIGGIFSIITAMTSEADSDKANNSQPSDPATQAPQDSPTPTQTQPTLSPTPRESFTSNEEPPSRPEPRDSDEPTNGFTMSSEGRYLTKIGPIGGYGNFEKEDAVQLGETVYSESVVFSPGIHNQEVKPLSFNVSSGLNTFKAVIGLDKDTLPDYVAHVSIKRRDGSTVKSVTLRSGEIHDVNESVTGAGLITITVSVLEWSSDATNSRPHIVVGDGRFVK